MPAIPDNAVSDRTEPDDPMLRRGRRAMGIARMPYQLSEERLAAMLREDVPFGDATTLGLGIGDRRGQAVFRTRTAITACCIEEAERIMLLAGCGTTRRLAASGQQVGAGAELLLVEGSAAALHRGLKVAQTLMEIASGIATRAWRILGAARDGRAGIQVACTRKHLPGAKDVMLKAIMAGGCMPHRLGLSDTVLVFAQHRAFLDHTPPHLWVAQLRAAQPERKIAVEAESVDEAMRFAAAGVDSLQLDKLAPDQVATVVRAIADLLVTSAAYAAPPADVSVSVTETLN
jgi:molybdenum transport protein